MKYKDFSERRQNKLGINTRYGLQAQKQLQAFAIFARLEHHPHSPNLIATHPEDAYLERFLVVFMTICN